jgi:putative oxidoreductase
MAWKRSIRDYCAFRNGLTTRAVFISLATIITIRPSRQGAHRRKELAMSYPRRIDLAAIVLRTAVGVMFVAHAALKYFVFTLPGTARFFESLGLPGVLGYATFAAELVGGLLLVAGIGTRTVAALLIPILLGATWAHSGNGWVFTAQNGGWEYPAFLTLAALVTAILGNGARDELRMRAGARPPVAIEAA